MNLGSFLSPPPGVRQDPRGHVFSIPSLAPFQPHGGQRQPRQVELPRPDAAIRFPPRPSDTPGRAATATCLFSLPSTHAGCSPRPGGLLAGADAPTLLTHPPRLPAFIHRNPRASQDGPTQLAGPRSRAQGRPRRPRLPTASGKRTRLPGGAARPLPRRDPPRPRASREPTAPAPRSSAAAARPRAAPPRAALGGGRTRSSMAGRALRTRRAAET